MIAFLVAATLIVSAGGPYTSIGDAMAAAQPGDTIVVRGGTHPAFEVTKPLTFLGEDGAVIDGGGHGSVVTISASDVTLAGFTVRGSGRTIENEEAGVAVTAARATVRDNTFRDVLFGITLKHAPDARVEGNDVRPYDYDLARRGDGLKAWYSPGAQLIGNHFERVRDIVIFFSDGSTVVQNYVVDSRYGLHFMYDDDMRVQGNELARNSVGMFIMYSSRVLVTDNLIHDNSGTNGYGVGLKEIDDLDMSGNVLLRNRVGVSFDTTPRHDGAHARLERNLVALGHVGLSMEPASRGVVVLENWFDRNGTQLEMRGGGDLTRNTWSEDRGNYWSDYVGYDANGDGVGDLPYEPRSLFETLRERHPVLSLFNYGPSALTVDFAARAVPNLRPGPKVEDRAPLMASGAPPWYRPDVGTQGGLIQDGVGLCVVALLAGFGLVGRGGGLRLGKRALSHEDVAMDHERPEALALHVQGLGKRYGQRAVLHDVSFEVRRGEAVALWGGNGAGKTTALRAILGVVRHEGTVNVLGMSEALDGRAMRQAIGYVPQELQLPDLPAGDLLEFFGGLRGVDVAAARLVSSSVGLEEHLSKRPGELSGGLRQRLALALAFVDAPPLLLLDEPTANLDAATRTAILDLLAHRRDGGTGVLFTTHREEEVVALADRVISLQDGAVISVRTAEEFARDIRRPAMLMVRVAPVDVDRAVEALLGAGFPARERAGWLTTGSTDPALPLRALWEAGIPVVESVVGAAE
jgi:nitrous oxidase accessory protein